VEFEVVVGFVVVVVVVEVDCVEFVVVGVVVVVLVLFVDDWDELD